MFSNNLLRIPTKKAQGINFEQLTWIASENPPWIYMECSSKNLLENPYEFLSFLLEYLLWMRGLISVWLKTSLIKKTKKHFMNFFSYCMRSFRIPPLSLSENLFRILSEIISGIQKIRNLEFLQNLFKGFFERKLFSKELFKNILALVPSLMPWIPSE